ncbi:hypothetical protein, partial [Streptomyces sp. NPDC056663]|uniref:hypothetical protein n=1 Tax=Streptomyces sp. NPDC056663 TaxID=3345899 RepID=UPI00369AB08D
HERSRLVGPPIRWAMIEKTSMLPQEVLVWAEGAIIALTHAPFVVGNIRALIERLRRRDDEQR